MHTAGLAAQGQNRREPTHGNGSDDASKGGADKRGIINRMTGDTNRRARFLNNDE